MRGWSHEQTKQVFPRGTRAGGSICDGRRVREVIRNIIPPIDDYETYYRGKFKGTDVFVVLSGFVGRIDNIAKRKLGREIESLLDNLQDYEV